MTVAPSSCCQADEESVGYGVGEAQHKNPYHENDTNDERVPTRHIGEYLIIGPDPTLEPSQEPDEGLCQTDGLARESQAQDGCSSI